MRIRLLETAKEDLRRAWRFYENQSVGLGDYFLDKMQADFERLMTFAGVHATEFGFHCMPAKRFPFAIYYLVESHSIDIYAVIDFRRDPLSIAAQLRAIKP